jgi:hypothetical protein
MPLNEKGKKIMKSMTKTYCDDGASEPCEQAESVFYASKNKGTIDDVETQMESLREFINGLKREDNEAFIENIVMKGLNACFETMVIEQSTDDDLPASEVTDDRIEKIEDENETDVDNLIELSDAQKEVEVHTADIVQTVEEREREEQQNNV